MKFWKSPLIAAAFCCVASLSAAEPFSDAEEARIKELAIEALLEQPEILRELIARLEAKDEAEQQARSQEAISALRSALIDDANAPVVGNPEGDVTVIEFMDYNCGFCKRATPEVAQLLERDPNVRLVYREWPILGDGSVAAARLALASRKQGAYAAMHDALMARPRVDGAAALAVARDLGLDVEQLQKDAEADEVEAHIAQSMALAQTIGVSGTPAFVIGDRFIGGLAPVDALLEAVEEARSKAQ